MPAETINLEACSNVTSRYIKSFFGTISKKPLVGFGVVGTKTLTNLLFVFLLISNSLFADEAMKWLKNEIDYILDAYKNDNLTKYLRKFNIYINKDKRTENLIIPVGDGLTICRKL